MQMYEFFFAVLFPKFRILDTKNRIRMDRKCAALPMGVGVIVATPGAVDTGAYALVNSALYLVECCFFHSAGVKPVCKRKRRKKVFSLLKPEASQTSTEDISGCSCISLSAYSTLYLDMNSGKEMPICPFMQADI